MAATPTEEQTPDISTAAPVEEPSASAEVGALTAEQAFDAEDLGIPEDVPTADDPSSRADRNNLEDAGFTIYFSYFVSHAR